MSWFLAPQDDATVASPRRAHRGQSARQGTRAQPHQATCCASLRRHVDLLPPAVATSFSIPIGQCSRWNSRNSTQRFCVFFDRRMRTRHAQSQIAGALPQGRASMITRLLLATLEFYRRWLSPPLHSLGSGSEQCRFVPTCSEYARVAIATHGPIRGMDLRSGDSCAAIRSVAEGWIPFHHPRKQRPLPGDPGTTLECRRPFAPRTVTIERAAAWWCATPQRQEVPFARNSQS